VSGLIGLLLVAVGGAGGGLLRYLLSVAVDQRTAGVSPWGTLLVNVSGAFLLGFLMGWMGFPVLTPTDSHVWLLLVVGVLGSYTTVSSFSLQTLVLLEEGHVGRAGWNVLLSFGLCLLAAAVGLASGVGLGPGPAA